MLIKTLLISIMSLMSLFAVDVDIERYVEDIRSVEMSQKASDTLSKVKSLNDDQILSSFNRILATQNIDEETQKEISLVMEKGIKEEKVLYFVYLTSKSVPDSTLKNFIYGLDKLNNRGHEIKGRIIYNGFNKEKSAVDFMEDLNVTDIKHSVININPFVFEDLNIKSVPAFLVAKCPNIFKNAKCEYQYIIKGESPFENYLKILSDEDESYDDFYNDFILQ